MLRTPTPTTAVESRRAIVAGDRHTPNTDAAHSTTRLLLSVLIAGERAMEREQDSPAELGATGGSSAASDVARRRSPLGRSLVSAGVNPSDVAWLLYLAEHRPAGLRRLAITLRRLRAEARQALACRVYEAVFGDGLDPLPERIAHD
jgi:hypothetical protein